ncbi:TPA: hypothetical protein WI661_000410 [Neisseria meningitidis]|uniref:hypothetical protein n=1 Tax=Neisseria TaxID=482 RepID=UPI0001D9DA9F|nr:MULTISPECIES: hypothetical protein [Neisseria]EFH22374.1 hypothetical protein NEIPOLOT_01882 [Neisseria polysaccharea ATCC 43768]CWO40608.1 Uncharacterised protein [Neisseria meningitidis]CWS29348.1 Uncharacterised protein [Neisseria meningitidis]
MHKRKDEQPLDFSDSFEISLQIFFWLLSSTVFGIVFFSLFTADQPVISTIFGGLIAAFATLTASPLTALAATLLGGILSGLLCWTEKSKTAA